MFTASVSQNLVPNYSFETFTICPSTVGQIESAVPWNAATTNSSTDYFNLCSSTSSVTSSVGIPYSLSGGFQYPRTGNAYAGFGFSYPGGQREYLQAQLTNPLVQNVTYYIEFFVNLHNANWAYASNNIAANLSTVRPFTTNTYDLQALTPHIVNPGNPIINDTLNWVQVSGCYTAQGGEEYITIGNFFSNVNTQFTGTTTASYSSYYYVEDVRVEAIPGVCVAGLKDMSDELGVMRLYPNPTINNLKVVITNLKDKEKLVVKITDVVGREVMNESYKEELDISALEKGIYFVSVYKDDKLLGTRKVVKE